MQFQEILDRFLVMSSGGECVTYYDPEEVGAEGHIVAEWGDEHSEPVRFDGSQEVTFDQHGEEFTVKALYGDTIYGFRAYTIVKFNPTDHPRAIKLEDAHVEQAEPNRLEVKVGKFDIRINHTDEGVVVDIWPWQDGDNIVRVEPLATCYAFDSDADDALSGE